MNGSQAHLRAFKTLLKDYRKLIMAQRSFTNIENLQKHLLMELNNAYQYDVNNLTRYLTLTLIIFPALDAWFVEALFVLPSIDSRIVLRHPKVKLALRDHPSLYLKYYFIGK